MMGMFDAVCQTAKAEAGGTKNIPWLVLVALAVYLIFAIGYAVGLPVDAGPDEAAHVRYIEILREYRTLPLIPAFGGGEHLHTIAAQHPPLYYAVLAVISAPFADIHSGTGMYVLRFVSVLMGLGAVLLVFTAARRMFGRSSPNSEASAPRLWPDSGALPAAAGFFALLPCHQYMTGVVNNSTGVILSAGVVVWAMSGAVQPDEESLRPWLWAGLGFAAAVACKLTGAWLGALILVAIIICARRDEWGLKRLAKTAGISLGPAIIVAGLWLGRSMALYGMFMPQSVTTRPLLPDAGILLIPELNLFFWSVLGPEILGGIAAPMWLLKPQDWEIWSVAGPVLGLLLLGLGGYVRARYEESDRAQSALAAACVAGFAAAVALVFWLMMRDYGALNFSGRYLQAAMPALGIAWAVGFSRLIRSSKIRQWALIALFAALIAFSIYTRGWIIGFQA